MAGGGGGTPSRELDETPTWAVSLVCAVIIIISIILEKVIHHVGAWFEYRRKRALVEALEKIKGELMVLGFISLLLTFGQTYIARICIPINVANTMLPCDVHRHHDSTHLESDPYDFETKHHQRRLLWSDRRLLAREHGHHPRLLPNPRRFLGGDDETAACKPGDVPLISVHGLHQLDIFIFFLAVFHCIFSATTMMLGRAKIRMWKEWEVDAAREYESDAMKFRLTHETSFVKQHTNYWTRTPFFHYIACFFRHFFRSVLKSDYSTMRNGFVSVHLRPGSKFNFQKYIKRSLEDDFKVVVGISPLLWGCAMFNLLVNVQGLELMFVLAIMPLIILLAVGTKLQSIITQMAVEITEKHAVVQGIPLVQVSDRHFWFSKPQFILTLIHLTLFQNAFQITYILWVLYEFGEHSCFLESLPFVLTRIVVGFVVQFLCSYITLPLYALVTQMGSTMKKTIFDDQTARALRNWQKNALKKKHELKSVTTPTRTLGGSPGNSPENSPKLQHAQ